MGEDRNLSCVYIPSKTDLGGSRFRQGRQGLQMVSLAALKAQGLSDPHTQGINQAPERMERLLGTSYCSSLKRNDSIVTNSVPMVIL